MRHRQSLPFRQCPTKRRDHPDGVTAVTRRSFVNVENQDRNDNQKEQRLQIPRIVLASQQRKPWAHEEKHPKDQRWNAKADRL